MPTRFPLSISWVFTGPRVMAYGDNGGAIGYLVGEENQGLACMFTMMNEARLKVGCRVSVPPGAYQRRWPTRGSGCRAEYQLSSTPM